MFARHGREARLLVVQGWHAMIAATQLLTPPFL